MKKTIEIDLSANRVTKGLLNLGIASFGVSMLKLNSKTGFLGRVGRSSAILAATLGGMVGVNKFVDEIVPEEKENAPEEVEVVKTEETTPDAASEEAK